MEILKQNVGIDISKDSFYVTLTVLLSGQILKNLGTKKFTNNNKGFKEFVTWVCKLASGSLPLNFTMEATGVYYENLAYYLKDKGFVVHVLIPTKVKKFAESLDFKSKTDKIDSKVIAQMGVERSLPEWEPGSKIFRSLRKLSRLRQQLVKERTRSKNQLHAESHSAEPLQSILKRYQSQIKYLDKQIKSVEKEIENLISEDTFIFEKVKKVITIPGVSYITAIAVIAETNGFTNFSSIKQLASYAGYDIVLKESGKYVGKTKISKKGNSHIRLAMFMASLSSIQHSQTYKTFYNRLNEKKQNGMVSGTAVQRKLLGLIFTLWKNDTEYIENYKLVS